MKRVGLVVGCGVVGPLVLAGCHDDDWLQYSWDDRRLLCSMSVDDLSKDPEWGPAYDQLRIARDNQSVALLHAHHPTVNVTLVGLERFFEKVAAYGLDYVTYPELVATDEHRAGVALAIDDNAIDSWHAQRELYLRHGARLTFFLSRYPTRTPEELDKLAELAADGHSIQAHGVTHLNAENVIPEIGLDAYIADEALPSITLLRDAGYDVTAFAYPFGRNTDVSDAILFEHVDKIRISPKPCPY